MCLSLEIAARGPSTDLDRRIAMLAEVLECRPEDIAEAAANYEAQTRLRYRLYNFLLTVAKELGKSYP